MGKRYLRVWKIGKPKEREDLEKIFSNGSSGVLCAVMWHQEKISRLRVQKIQPTVRMRSVWVDILEKAHRRKEIPRVVIGLHMDCLVYRKAAHMFLLDKRKVLIYLISRRLKK